MLPHSESTAVNEGPMVEASRRKAVTQLLQEPRSKKSNSIYHQLFHARLCALVQRDEHALLSAAMAEMLHDHDAGTTAESLWYLALLEGKTRTLEMLCLKSQEKPFKFLLSRALDDLPESLQMWALNIPNARNIWAAETQSISAREGYRFLHGLKMLEVNQAVKELYAALDGKTEAFHARMRLFIAERSMPTLMQSVPFCTRLRTIKNRSLNPDQT